MKVKQLPLTLQVWRELGIWLNKIIPHPTLLSPHETLKEHTLLFLTHFPTVCLDPKQRAQKQGGSSDEPSPSTSVFLQDLLCCQPRTAWMAPSFYGCTDTILQWTMRPLKCLERCICVRETFFFSGVNQSLWDNLHKHVIDSSLSLGLGSWVFQKPSLWSICKVET